MKKIKDKKLVIILIIIICILLLLWQYDNISSVYYEYQFNQAKTNTDDFLKNEAGNIVLLNDPEDNHAILVQLNTKQKPIASMEFEEFYDEIDNYHNDKGAGIFGGNNIVLTNNTERKSILLNLNTQKIEDVPYITSDNFSATSAEEYTVYKISGLKTEKGFKNGKMEYHFTEKYPMTIGNEQEYTLQGITDVTIVFEKEYSLSELNYNN